MPVPATPRPLQTFQKEEGSLTLAWTAPAGPVTSYTLLCEGQAPRTVDGTQTRITITGLDKYVAYKYSITATNADGTSPAAPFRLMQPACDKIGFI